MPQSFEEQLIKNASNGDLESFNQLVLSHQDIAFRYANSLVDDPASAEDITQESFIKAFQHINTFRGSLFRAWLLTIVKNTSRDKIRWNSRRARVSLFPKDKDGEEIDPNVSVESLSERASRYKKTHRYSACLNSSYCLRISLRNYKN